jgi:flagellar biosynthesis protein FliQ
MLQAATRQNDPTLNTVPKLLGVGGALLIFGAWMTALLQGFWYDLWSHLPEMVR